MGGSDEDYALSGCVLHDSRVCITGGLPVSVAEMTTYSSAHSRRQIFSTDALLSLRLHVRFVIQGVCIFSEWLESFARPRAGVNHHLALTDATFVVSPTVTLIVCIAGIGCFPTG